jgi:carnitine 3-dehydrogenase
VSYPSYEAIETVGILGTGTIGASWAAYFLAHGYRVVAWDPAPEGRARGEALIDTAWPQLQALGLSPGADRSAIAFRDTAEEVVAESDFIQENAPERMPIKQDLYARIDRHLKPDAILSSSTSGLIMSEMQAGLANAARFVVGHPFNPPHLVPLVEVVGGRETDPAAVDWLIGFYFHAGKHAIRVKKELPGHLANRLQAALWREAVMAVVDDVASVEDINAAIAKGPGLRLAVYGPHMVFNLAGGKAGFQGFWDHFGPGIAKWLSTMTENPDLTDGTLRDRIIAGLAEEAGDRSIDDLEEERDAKLIAVLKTLAEEDRRRG